MQSDRVIRLVEQILARNSIHRPVSADDELVAVGLTSIDMVNLMLAVEAEFGMMIPQSDITPENFRSVSSIGSLVAKLAPDANAPQP